MKKTYSLRVQLFLLMAALVLLQSMALVASLAFSQVFLMLDAEAFRLFDSTTGTRTGDYNTSVGLLIANMAEETEQLAGGLAALARQREILPEALYQHDAAYTEAAVLGAESAIGLLRNNIVSGAFFLLNGSSADKTDPDAHAGVYLRNSAPGSASGNVSNYLLEIGPIAVSQQHQIPASINWRLHMSLPEGDEAAALYTEPIRAAREDPRAEIERYGFWSPPVYPLADSVRAATYTMPLIAPDGTPYGVLGVEISMSLFNQYYLPNTDLPYQSSFYAIATVRDGALDLSWFVPSGPLAQTYLGRHERLALSLVRGGSLYETELSGMGSMYCSIQPLTIYSRNSPFYDSGWSLVGFVPQHVLHETSSGVRSVLVFSILATTLLSFAAIFLLLFFVTRRLSGLSEDVRSLNPYTDIHFSRTGIREIDDLTGAVEMLSRSVMNASKTTSRILELTSMPLGAFEVSSDNACVVLTEFINRLLGLAPGAQLTREEWAEVYAELTASPDEKHENIYHFCSTQSQEERWLRILEAETDTGKVGIILDATADIEEHRRLAHELDYDALTHLYSRTAFKREAFRRITQTPDSVGAMIFLDLDNLKYINDTFGHDMGDRLIIRAGELFRQFERVGGIVSRISGDEFAIYLHGYEDIETLSRVIYEQFARGDGHAFVTPNGETQRIRFSAGIAYYPTDSDDITDLLKLSDYAMYEAKHNQKGSVFTFNRASYQENAYLLENREAINRLLDEALIRFAFQPIVDLRTGEVFAYEALMRPLLENFKSPLEILSVAEAQSKLRQLERTVIFTAMAAVRENLAPLAGLNVFINSIPSQTLDHQVDIERLRQRFADVFGQIVIEIIEAENKSPERMQEKLDHIRGLGMRVALDDFGSGYSNEIRILSINPDIVKIDIELISGIDQNEDKRKLVENLISFCHPKGILVVGEGVERPEELAALIRLDVDFVQGYYTGRPNYEILPVKPEIKEEILRLRGAAKEKGP